MDRREAMEVLGLPPGGFTRHQLTKAYREQVRLHHPDVHGPGHDLFMRMINIARDTLWELAVDSEISMQGEKYSNISGSPEVEAKGARAEPDDTVRLPSHADTGLLARLKRKGNYTPTSGD